MDIRFSDYEKAAESSSKYIKMYRESLKNLLVDLNSAIESAAISGDSHNEISFFSTELGKTYSITEGLAEQINSTIIDFLNQLDSATKIDGVNVLYDRKYDGLRDYSSATIFRLSQYAEDANYDDGLLNSALDWIQDKVVYTVAKINKALGYPISADFLYIDTSVKKNLFDAQTNLLQFKDVTVRRLHDMYEQINLIEKTTTTRLTYIADAMKTMNEHLYCLWKNLNEADGNISVNNHGEIEKLSHSLQQEYNKLIAVSSLTDDQITSFMDDGGYNIYSDEHVNIVNNGIDDILNTVDFQHGGSFWDFLAMSALLGADIVETNVKSVLTKEDYDDLILKNEVLSMLQAEADSFDINDLSYKKNYDTFMKILKDVKKYGIEGYKALYAGDKRYKAYRDKIELFSKMDHFFDVLDHTEKGVEIVASLLTDYTRNMELLDSLDSTCSYDAKMKEAYHAIRLQYSDVLFSACTQSLNYVCDTSMDVLTSTTDKLFEVSVFSVVGKVKKAVGLIGDMSGEGERKKAQYELLSYGRDLLSSTKSALNASLHKLAGLSKSDAGYETAMNDVRNNFAIYRRNLSSAYEKLALSSSGDKRSYYYYLSQKASSMSINDLSKKVTTFEEYIKSDIKKW